MIRIICFDNNYGNAANVGGPNVLTHKTFDVDLPSLEEWLGGANTWAERGIVGIEVIKP